MKKKNANYYKNCSRCNSLYGTGDLGEELMFGEPADSCVEIYDTKYNLCPDCTRQLHSFLTNNSSLNSNAIKLKAYKEMAKHLKERKSFEMPKYGISDVAPAVTFKVIDEFIEKKEKELSNRGHDL